MNIHSPLPSQPLLSDADLKVAGTWIKARKIDENAMRRTVRDFVPKPGMVYECPANKRAAMLAAWERIGPPFEDSGAILASYDYEPIAVAGKRPIGTGWQRGPADATTVAATRSEHPEAVNTGLRCGALVGLDIDLADAEHTAALVALATRVLGDTPLHRLGSKGCLLAYRNAVPCKKITVKANIGGEEKPAIEILGQGQQFVAFGIHPDTLMPYRWLRKDGDCILSPQIVPHYLLPEVSEAKLRAFAAEAGALLVSLGYGEAHVTGSDKSKADAKSKEALGPYAREYIEEAVSYIDPSGDRDKWVKYIAAFADADIIGDDANHSIGREIAVAWSRGELDREKRYVNTKPTGYTDDADVVKDFNSMKPRGGGITVRYLFTAATKAGWKPARQPYDYSGKPASEKFAKANIPPPKDDAANKPGLKEALEQSQEKEEKLVDERFTTEIEEAEKKRLRELLHLFNEHFSVALMGSKARKAKIVEFENGGKLLRFQDLDDFKLRFRNLRAWLRVPGRNPKWTEVAECWLNWPHRRQYFKDGLVFAPGRPLEWDGGLNRWRGFAIKPVPGDWSLLRDLIERVLCGGNKEVSDYLLNWCAHLVQKPGVLTKACPVLRSDHEGAGKGLFAHTFGSIFGRNFSYIQRGKDVTGQFNASIAETLFAALDELFAGDYEASEILKTLISDKDRRSEEKHMPVERIPNHLNLLIMGNSEWMARTGIKNRRMVYIDVPELYKPDDPYWAQFWKSQTDPDNPGVTIQLPPLEWRQAMLSDLLHRDISGFNPTTIPHTVEEGRQKILSQPGLPAFVQKILTDGEIEYRKESAGPSGIGFKRWQGSEPLWIKCSLFEATLREHCKNHNVRNIPFGPQLSRNLDKLLPGCVETTRPRDKDVNPERQRGYAFKSLAECKAAFDKAIGSPLEWEKDGEG